VLKEAVSVSAWIAVRELPFNVAAIVDHMKGNQGYFLGMNAKGQIVFRVGDGKSVKECVTESVPLYEWTHVAAVYGHAMIVYVNGKPVKSVEQIDGGLSDAPETDLSIGMTRSFVQHPPFSVRKCTRQFKSNMVFSGLIDEVKVFNDHLVERDVKEEYEALKPKNKKPLKPWSLPYGPKKSPRFGAMYTKLQYSPEWDGLWRVGDYSDILVTFDDKPWRYVFWRGTRYLPSLVTGPGANAVWSNDQGPEDYRGGQAHEHMSDMLCRFSNARVIHNSEARTMVHWRNSSVSISYKWPSVDAEGRGVWTDEYWTIYPDGVSIRHQLVHNNTAHDIICELNQNEILIQPGQSVDDVINDDAVIIANTDGETEVRYYSKPPRRKLSGNWNLQYLNLKSKTKQFQIGEVGSWSQTFLHSDLYRRGWNHYPVQLMPSDGTCVYKYDRPSCTCPATFHELRHMDGNNIEAMVMYGLTDKKAEELTSLNRSWNFAPDVVETKGCKFDEYRRQERAFKFTAGGDVAKFTINASKKRPLENPAFVIAGWTGDDADVTLKMNGSKKKRGKDFKAGIEMAADGSYSLVIWMKYSSEKTVSFEIVK
jgi:hypothetical protein